MRVDALFLFIWALWLGSEILVVRILRSGSSDRRQDAASLRLLWITISLSITSGVVIGMQPIEATVLPDTWRHGGMAIIVLGMLLRWAAILTLRRNFTVDVAIRKDHRLVTTGLYRRLRHPSYSGSLLSFLGLGLSFGNVFSIAVVVVPILSAFINRIRIEEKALIDTFGVEYLEYRRTSWRLIPWVY